MHKPVYLGPLSPEYALLGLLAQRPAHGYELHQRLVTELGQIWHTSQSQTYNILNRLEAQGYIAGETVEQEKLPARKRFILTQLGHERFLDWLRSPGVCSARSIRVEFLTRLHFARSTSPEMAKELFEEQLDEVRRGLARLNRMLAEVPPEQVINRLGLDLRIRQLESILKWLTEARSLIEASEDL